ncbi:MAG: hypothetical protein V7776_05120 [Halopseudomonas aestusnigri]
MIKTEIAEVLTLELQRLHSISKKIHQSSVVDEINTSSANLEYALRQITPEAMVDALVNSFEKADIKAA